MSDDEIELAEVIRLALDTRQRNMHTALPGAIVSYDAGTQTASIDLLVELSVPSRSKGHAYERIPTLHGVPIGHPRGGGFVMHFPLVPGDHVWVMFSERSLDEVIKNGSRSQPRDLRMHNLSFAYAIPASSPAQRAALEDMPADALVIGREDDDECQIRISSDGIVLSSGGTAGPVALADLVHASISAMLQAGVSAGGPGAPNWTAAKGAWDAVTMAGEPPDPPPPAGLTPVGATRVTAE
jgi:hypothetical protein